MNNIYVREIDYYFHIDEQNKVALTHDSNEGGFHVQERSCENFPQKAKRKKYHQSVETNS